MRRAILRGSFPRLRWRECLGCLVGGLAGALGAQPRGVTGLVEPDWRATLAATVLGRVESIAVKEGDAVEAGAVLLLLERRFEEIDARRRQIVAESTVELELARSKLEVLRTEFEGTRRLFEGSGSVSKDAFERARLDLLLAEAELAQLEQREKVEALEWQLAREQVERREIRAPRAGTVVEVFPKEGEVCEPRQPLLVLVDARTVRLTLEIDALATAGLAVGQTLPVRLEAPGGELVTEGRIDFVSPVVDAASGFRRVRLTIENPEGRILPGLPATVTLE
jgi:RND family efflux transporter MFP subunit